MPWYIAAIVANLAIAGVEFVNRRSGSLDTGLMETLALTAPLIFIAQIGLYYCWRDAPSMMLAWAVFTVGNTSLRMISSQYMVGEPLSWATVAGVSTIFFGAYLVKVGS
jgi:hypothetical protein